MHRIALCALIAFSILQVLLPHTATAHVLLKDTSGRVGMVLHSTPNDDPVAGTQTDLYFDIQLPHITRAKLTIAAADDTADVPVTIQNTALHARYTFPDTDVYALTLNVQSGSSRYTFHYDQRVAHGASGNNVQRSAPPAWAQLGVTLALCGIALLLILMYNRRQDIRKQSTW